MRVVNGALEGMLEGFDTPGGLLDCEPLEDVMTDEKDDVRDDEADDDRSGGQKPW